MKRKEKTKKDCQNDRVPSLTLFYLHVVSYINLFVLFYFIIFLHALFFSVCPNKLSWLNVKKCCMLMYLKFICRLWLQPWHFFLDMMKKTKIKKTVIVIKRLAKSLHLLFVCVSFPWWIKFCNWKDTTATPAAPILQCLIACKTEYCKKTSCNWDHQPENVPWVVLNFFYDHLFKVAKWNLGWLKLSADWPDFSLIGDL